MILFRAGTSGLSLRAPGIQRNHFESKQAKVERTGGGINNEPLKAYVVRVALHHDDAVTRLDRFIKSSFGGDQIVNPDGLFTVDTVELIRARIADGLSSTTY